MFNDKMNGPLKDGFEVRADTSLSSLKKKRHMSFFDTSYVSHVPSAPYKGKEILLLKYVKLQEMEIEMTSMHEHNPTCAHMVSPRLASNDPKKSIPPPTCGKEVGIYNTEAYALIFWSLQPPTPR